MPAILCTTYTKMTMPTTSIIMLENGQVVYIVASGAVVRDTTGEHEDLTFFDSLEAAITWASEGKLPIMGGQQGVHLKHKPWPVDSTNQ